VLVQPIQVGVEGVYHILEAFFAIVAIAEEDPVERTEDFGYFLGVHLTAHDRNQPLVVLDGVSELLLAYLRSYRVGTDHEHEDVGILYAGIYLREPFCGRWDVL